MRCPGKFPAAECLPILDRRTRAAKCRFEKASKYRTEEAEIKSEAERKEVEAKTNFHKHEVLARGVTMFQIAIAIAAISALTKKRKFWTVSLLFGAVGCVFLVLGMFAR